MHKQEPVAWLFHKLTDQDSMYKARRKGMSQVAWILQEGQAEVSKNKDEVHQICGPPLSRALYTDRVIAYDFISALPSVFYNELR